MEPQGVPRGVDGAMQCVGAKSGGVRTGGGADERSGGEESEPQPGPPPAAREIFGDRLSKAERYAALLKGPGLERGLIGPREASRVWERHILNCAVVAELVPSPCTLADIGSGAGLPGIVLAIALPGVSVTLVEPLLRRSVFLEECVVELGLKNAVVCRARAEELKGVLSADVVTARAVAPMRQLAVWAAGVVRPGGTILALKGDRAGGELREAKATLRKLGLQSPEIVTVGSGRVEPETLVVRIVAGQHGTRAVPVDPSRSG